MITNAPTIFLAFANDPSRPLPRLSDEADVLRSVLEPLEESGVCKLVVREHASLNQVANVFSQSQSARTRGQRIAVFHFAGHANDYQLSLEEPALGGFGNQVIRRGTVDGASFARFLGGHESLHLVFLNGCATRKHAEALLAAGVKVVVVTSDSVRDDVSRDFAGHFYKALGNGKSICWAFENARSLLESSTATGAHRDLLRPEVPAAFAANIVPWELYVSDRYPDAADWDLATAAGDPFFGFSPLPRMALPVGSPYRRLEWYAEEHAPVFFGRGWDTRRLYDKVTNPHLDPVVFVFGQTGVGKSSLLAAGLIPRLKAQHPTGPAPLYLRRDRGLGLAGTLRRGLREVVAGDEVAVWRAREVDGPLVLILDQAEEAFTRPRSDGHVAELSELMTLLSTIFAEPARRPQGKLVLSFRKEWLAELNEAADAHGVQRSDFHVPPLDTERIIEVIRGPADDARLREHYGLAVVDGVSDAIARDLVKDPDAPVAPMLQVLLDKLWTSAKAEDQTAPRFTETLYRRFEHRMGLDVFLDEQLAEMRITHADAVDSGLALDILEGHTTDIGTAEQCALTDLQATYPHYAVAMSGLVHDFKSRYVLVDPPSLAADQSTASRLAHDTLAPLVRERFVHSDRPGQRARRIIESRRADPHVPLDEHELGLVEAGLRGMRTLDRTETTLLATSREARSRRQRIRRMAWAALGTAVFLIIGVAAIALLQRQEAVAQSQAATIRGVWGQLAEQRLDRRLLLAAQISRFDNYWNAGQWQDDDGLIDALLSVPPQLAEFLDYRDQVVSIAFSPNGRLLAYGSADSIILWDVTSRQRLPTTFMGHKSTVTSVAFSPDSSLLASGSSDNTIILWDVASQQRLTEPLVGHADVVTVVAFSPDGKILASGSWDKMIILWDVASHQRLESPLKDNAAVNDIAFSMDSRILAADTRAGITLWDVVNRQRLGEPLEGSAIAFSPDGKTLASGSRSNIILWDVMSQQRLGEPFVGHSNDVLKVTFSPDGKTLASGGFDNVIFTWDVESRQPLWTLEGHQDTVFALAFSPDGKTLASGSADNTIILWDPNARPPLNNHIFGLHDPVGAIAFSPDGKILATGSTDNTIILWDLASQQRSGKPLDGHSGSIYDLAFSPDGNLLASGGVDGSVFLWDVASRRPLWTLEGHQDAVYALAFSPDGNLLASGGVDESVFLWDVASRRPLWTLEGHQDAVYALAFSPDGNLLASGGVDESVFLWDVTRGQRIEGPPMDDVGIVGSVSFSSDGKALVAAAVE